MASASTIYPPPPLPQSTQVAYAQAASDMNPFEARSQSTSSSQNQNASQPMPYANMSTHHTQQSNPPHASAGYSNYFRNFPSTKTSAQSHDAKPQIYTAVYSSVAVYEMEVHGIAVMRRRSDSWLNATQILKVAGVEKGKRTKILEKEILTGPHEKIQGGYGKYQGTWIDYQRGREFCRQYGVEDVLRPLLDYDLNMDGTAGSGQVDTPTKEQAMAANRKKFYNTGIERLNSGTSSGPFFQNISPTASNALAAMNKAARYESPMTRPGGSQRPSVAVVRRTSQLSGSQETGADPRHNGSLSENGFMSKRGSDATYAPLGISPYDHPGDMSMQDAQEPPRKRLKPSSATDHHGLLDPALQEDTQTEINESFIYEQHSQDLISGPIALAPLYPPDDKVGEEKRLALLDLFADSTRTDFSSHSAILHLSGQDLDLPLDQSANTALHWAATLARVSLMRLLISKGADIFRGNAAGQTPLMAAVQVNNSLDHSCFPEMLEILGPLIEIQDVTGRTVLHHIAVASGIKGRGVSTRYYLESLLEFMVRRGGNAAEAPSDADGASNPRFRTIGLSKFMSDVVNVQDKSGNTALNLVARIGNRAIIEQLDEVGADYTIPNKTGFRPIDFGVFPRGPPAVIHTPTNPPTAPTDATTPTQPPTQLDQIKEEIFASKSLSSPLLLPPPQSSLTHLKATTSILSQTQSQYTAELRKKQSIIDASNAELATLATTHKTELEAFELLQRRARDRAETVQQIDNLRRALAERPAPPPTTSSPTTSPDLALDPAALEAGDSSHLPTSPQLRARLAAHRAVNARLAERTQALRLRSKQLEAQYRKVVALCTGVDEERVDGMLDGLLAAVESEGGEGVEVGRVREFLRMVDYVQA